MQRTLAVLTALALFGGATLAQQSDVSPIRQIEHTEDRTRNNPPPPPPPPQPGLARTIDGSGNNVGDPQMGAAFTGLRREMGTDYADGASAMAGDDRPGPREISNAMCAQTVSIANEREATDFLWQWGQFVDHDIDLTDGVDPPEPANIVVPAGDHYFDPYATGSVVIPFNRSIYDASTGTDAGNPRQQVNEISAWVDASNVYGSDEERATALRAMDGSGRLRMTDDGLLPPNDAGLPNAGGTSSDLFLAGDVRANEQVGLTALHTLFVREHNRLAHDLASRNPGWDGERIYQTARRLVGAEMQIITYREFLPALLGPTAIRPYNGYRPNVDAAIANEFSAAAYRFGHSALSPTLLRLNAAGDEIAEGHLPLSQAFFSPSVIEDEGGIEPLLRGLASQHCQAIDPFLVDDVRNFLFGPPGAGGFDLASLNIQRGRDHGLPGYNEARRAMGLSSKPDLAAISSNPVVRERLASVYDDVEDVDMWVGALAEDPVPGAHVGELNFVVIKQQFEALRDGDRFWWEIALNPQERHLIQGLRLSDVIRRNTSIGHEITRDVFHAGPRDGGPHGGPPHGNPGPGRREFGRR
ncbi:MAG: peroxiredoxin [bacterium]|nr:peroxiredoxin [bacterium]